MFDEDLGFKIESGRHAEIFMSRTRKAIDAAMLATSVWIRGKVHTDVGTVIARNNRARSIAEYLRWNLLVDFLLTNLKQCVECFGILLETLLFEASGRIIERAAAANGWSESRWVGLVMFHD